ncbi:MAG: hypothetical protein IK114_10370 [Fibrobacter sp.]|nr:hypothetical protein [Fibrobacter sp.]
MKKAFICLLLAVVSAFPVDGEFFVGMRNQRFLFTGLQHGPYGVVYEQSLLNQDPEQQHGRLWLYAEYSLPLSVTLWYALYGEMQYDLDYYEYGGELALQWAPKKFFQLKVCYRPFYDSDYLVKHGYLLKLYSQPFKDVGFFVGVKNMPDYRNVERRFFGGALFDVGRLVVYPEISTPVHGSFEWTRVNLNFVYRYDFN